MKKLYFLVALLPNLLLAQLSTPNNQIIPTSNPETGNVGVGINNPSQKLTIANALEIGQGKPSDGTNSTAILRLLPSNNGYGEVFDFGMSIYPSVGWIQPQNYQNKTFYNLSINPLGGNVGIGTDVPQSKLDVSGTLMLGGSQGNLDITQQPNILDNLKNTGKLLLGWNLSGGKGEADFISNRGDGVIGGFHFYDLDNSGLIKQLFVLNNNGNALLNGKLEAKEIKVIESPTADFVFEESYNLPTLQEVEKHIKEKKHLPEIPSAKKMEKEGVNIGEFQIKLLQKIEELTLYIIEQNKEIKKQREEINQLKINNL